MKVKKIFLSALASVVAMSSFVSMNSSAIGYDTGTPEQYNALIEYFNTFDTPAPELVDAFDGVFPEYNIKNVWVTRETTSQWSSYMVEILNNDSFYVYFETLPEGVEGVIDELNSELGMYEEIAKIGVDEHSYEESVGITFNGENHERNLMIAEKAYSLLKDKYDVEHVSTNFAGIDFIPMDIQSAITSVNGITWLDSKEDLMAGISNINVAEHDWLNETYGATLTEQGQIKFPEDITDIEKLECFKYLVEKYNVSIYRYSQASGMSDSLMDIDFERDGVKYLSGDANEDGELTVADATLILQSLGNADKYSLAPQGKFNADIHGDGISALDALEIQKTLANG